MKKVGIKPGKIKSVVRHLDDEYHAFLYDPLINQKTFFTLIWEVPKSSSKKESGYQINNCGDAGTN